MTRCLRTPIRPDLCSRPHSQGFSLIELVVTMGIAAILASIAIPAYNSYVLKSHRTEAKTALLDMASMEERYFTTTSGYSTAPTDLGYSAWPIVVGSGYYQILQANLTVVPATAPSLLNPAGTPASFQIVATPVPGNMQTQDTACTSFTVNSNGTKTATGSPTATTDCWN